MKVKQSAWHYRYYRFLCHPPFVKDSGKSIDTSACNYWGTIICSPLCYPVLCVFALVVVITIWPLMILVEKCSLPKLKCPFGKIEVEEAKGKEERR